MKNKETATGVETKNRTKSATKVLLSRLTRCLYYMSKYRKLRRESLLGKSKIKKDLNYLI